MDLEFSLQIPLTVIHWLALQGWQEPFQLAVTSVAELKMRGAVLPRSEMAFDIWKAGVLVFAIPVGPAELPLRGVPRDAEALIACCPSSQMAAQSATPPDAIVQKQGAHRMGPSAKLKELRAKRAPDQKVLDFCKIGMRRGALRPIHLSMP